MPGRCGRTLNPPIRGVNLQHFITSEIRTSEKLVTQSVSYNYLEPSFQIVSFSIFEIFSPQLYSRPLTILNLAHNLLDLLTYRSAYKYRFMCHQVLTS